MSYDPKPMAVVISNNLDPVVQRQLYAGIRADIMTADQIAEQHDDIATAESTADQVAPEQPSDSSSDESVAEPGDLGAGDTSEESSDATESESSEEGDSSSDESQDADEQTESTDDDESSEEDSGDGTDSSAESEDGEKEETGDDNESESNVDGDDESNAEDDEEADLESIKKGAGFEAYFADDADGTEPDAETEGATEPTDESDDNQQVIKSFFYVHADASGLTPEQLAIPGIITKPKDAIVVIDRTDVPGPEVAQQLSRLQAELEGKGVTVKDNLQDAISLINQVSDEIEERKGGEISQEGFMSKVFGPKKNPKEEVVSKMLAALVSVAGMDQPTFRTEVMIRTSKRFDSYKDMNLLFKDITEDLKLINSKFTVSLVKSWGARVSKLTSGDDYSPKKHGIFASLPNCELSLKVLPSASCEATFVTMDNIIPYEIKGKVDVPPLRDLILELDKYMKSANDLDHTIDSAATVGDLDDDVYYYAVEGVQIFQNALRDKVVESLIKWLYSYISVTKVSNEGILDIFSKKPAANMTLEAKVKAIRKALEDGAPTNPNGTFGVAVSREYADKARGHLPDDFMDKVVADFEVIGNVFTPAKVRAYLSGITSVIKANEDFFNGLDVTDMSGALAKFKGKTLDKVLGAWTKGRDGKITVLTLGLTTQTNPLVYQDGSVGTTAGGFIDKAPALNPEQILKLLNVIGDTHLHSELVDCDRMFDNTGNAGHAVDYYLISSLFSLLDEYCVQISNYVDWAYQSIKTK